MGTQRIILEVVVHATIREVGEIRNEDRLDQIQIGDHHQRLKKKVQPKEPSLVLHLVVLLDRDVRDRFPVRVGKVPVRKPRLNERNIPSGPVRVLILYVPNAQQQNTHEQYDQCHGHREDHFLANRPTPATVQTRLNLELSLPR